MAEHNEIEMAEDHVEMVDHSKIIENKAIPMQILRDATSNFGVENLLGEGGFGSVYRGTLQDGREIAVKKMNQSAIAENDRLLVYQYMPQGTLSKHLFHWGDHSLRPLDWTTRLSIALDVARSVEYLHTLALQNQSYIHRDLKPPNILLGDDLRAKASDFGLVTATEEDRESVKTKCRGTPGYMAPEYLDGRVTRKIDVYSFRVILMELITGKKATDHSRAEDDIHITTWLR
ncbi:receptor-like kinase TMK2 [Brassica napus]|uniref:receptor-like kinase TMK2 n=1 Tax=Brassica napus TaxID=3708 RepID=UPI002079F72D|nr:receptor-like kinase TMK2 [Brassica napus]